MVGNVETTPARAAPYFHFSATLRVFGDIADPEGISSALGLRPTHTHRQGETGRGGKAYRHDSWQWTAPVPEERPLDAHIQTLWSQLKPHKDHLLRLKERCAVDVHLGYRSDADYSGFEVSPKSLEMFVELDIPFSLNVVVT